VDAEVDAVEDEVVAEALANSFGANDRNARFRYRPLGRDRCAGFDCLLVQTHSSLRAGIKRERGPEVKRD
jgi:hypothetical protein